MTCTLLSLVLVSASTLVAQPLQGGDEVSLDRAEPGTLPLEEIRRGLAAPRAHEPYVPTSLLGLPKDLAEYIPADNPLTPAKVELGRQLYFDKRLSRDGTVSCATCHDPVMGWTDCEPVSEGIDGQKGGRSAPTVVNRLLGQTQFWDGRAASLEEQALGPIANPIEMGFTVEDGVALLATIPGYRLQFEAVFGGPPSADGVAKAIAAFERTVLSGANRNDYFEAAMPWFDWDPAEEDDPETKALGTRLLREEELHRMSESAERGRALYFGKASCSTCHVGYDLTDELFHNIGIGMDAAEPDLGRFAESKADVDRGAFKTPSLRDIVKTAPYMHDGSLKTLMEVVEHYDKGGIANPWLSDKIFPLKLTDQEKRDLVTFMEEALTGESTRIQVPRLP